MVGHKGVPCLRWLIAALVVTTATVGGAAAQQQNRFTVLEENDSLFFNSDKHYTQGLRLSNLFPPVAPGTGWNAPFDFVDSFVPWAFPQGGRREYSFLLGQSIFTPKNTQIKPPDPRDRPYAGWLYGGLSLLQESGGRSLENLEIDFGVVGPPALGRQVQNDFHQFIGESASEGWSSQIQTELGGMVSYERLWRIPLLGNNGFGVDIVPQAGVTAGNIFTYADVGGMVRIGRGLDADYGPARVRPALSGTDYFNADGLDEGTGFYFFAGTQGRAVGHNIFLEGNTFRTGRSVPKKTLVGDVQAGFSWMWNRNWRADISVVLRSPEFQGQHGPDDICTAALTFSW
ncbi:MAG TPA: lipid A deacylase LpxR family protein [Stellaceae bacterium]|nr:lipid A deacylase LpxR family protein [Stellaceae bacterium]